MMKLGSAREGDEAEGRPVATGSIYIVVDDPESVYARDKAANATITRELRDEDYGSRDFGLRDAEGIMWTFGTYAGAGAER